MSIILMCCTLTLYGDSTEPKQDPDPPNVPGDGEDDEIPNVGRS